jgi:hypothetical protein
MLVQNTTNRTVNGFYNTHTAAGTQVFGTGLTIAPFSALTANLCTVGGGAANGTSGTIVLYHDGGYGGLTGKAVALEPATGFSFDTLGTSLPN